MFSFLLFKILWSKKMVEYLNYISCYKCCSIKNLDMRFSRLLIKIVVWLFFCAHSITFSVQKCKNIETSSSQRLFKMIVYFLAKIPLINDNLLYLCFVRWSVGPATKGVNLSLIVISSKIPVFHFTVQQ